MRKHESLFDSLLLHEYNNVNGTTGLHRHIARPLFLHLFILSRPAFMVGIAAMGTL